MSTAYPRMQLTEIRHNLSSLHRKWGWFVVLGIAMIALGAFALSSLVVATFATALAIGIMLIAGGIVEVVGSFWSRGWSGFFLHLLFGVLAIVVGVLFLRAPVDAVLTLTMLMACLLMAGGLLSIIAAAGFRFSGWGLAVGERNHRLGAGNPHLVRLAGDGPLGVGTVPGDQPRHARLHVDCPRAWVARVQTRRRRPRRRSARGVM